MYTGINQYHVVLEVLPEYQQNPSSLKQTVRSIRATEPPVPLSNLYTPGNNDEFADGKPPGAVSRQRRSPLHWRPE